MRSFWFTVALLVLGIIVGMPVFFEVGLVLLMPIVAEAARRTGRPPVLAGCRCWRGSPLCMARCRRIRPRCCCGQYHADLGHTILWGLAAGLPAAALAGPGLGWFLTRRWEKRRKKDAPVEEGLALFEATTTRSC